MTKRPRDVALDAHSFSVNTYDQSILPIAKRTGLGLEVEEYRWIYSADEISEKNKSVRKLMDGFSECSFHGTAVSRDFASISRMPDERLLSLYNASYGYARFLGIHKIVFHSNYSRSLETESSWVSNQADLWKLFLSDKSTFTKVYLENFIDDNPDLLAKLCDKVNDARFRICFDAGHACCNASVGETTNVKESGYLITKNPFYLLPMLRMSKMFIILFPVKNGTKSARDFVARQGAAAKA